MTFTPVDSNTIGEVLPINFKLINLTIESWANRTPDTPALIFLEDGETETERVSYQQLHQRAGEIAQCLRQRQLVGERVLLLFHSRIDYITAFFGCLYAGVIAVPVYPPRNNYHAERVLAIAHDAQARTVLTMQYLRADIEAKMAALSADAALEILAVDGPEMVSSSVYMNREQLPEQVAYLQYTSGSTGTPKGVMVKHGNLIQNCLYSAKAQGLPEGRCFVAWLPIFHDLGLVHGICLPLTLGGTAVFMPSPVFVQKPLRWLKAISRYRAVYTPAPNFAYELCATKITAVEAATLDLSCWQVALNGAEPIALSTLNKFRAHFAASGFDPATFSSGYGLAETTLLVTSGKHGEMTPVLYLDAEEIKQDKVVLLNPDDPLAKAQVSSGWIMPDPHVKIVNPNTMLECNGTEVGEIWVSGSSNCAGYWRRAQESVETFAATLAATGDTCYIRTGDLGFAHAGQLYVTGRLKDLIIIRGANHYPQDIERTAEDAHPALRKGGWAAAFTLEDAPDAPQLVIVIEVERTERKKVDATEAGLAIMRAVTEKHGIDVDLVVLIDPAGIPKTSSGKIQRRPCKAMMLAGELSEIGRWQRFRDDAAIAAVTAPDTNRPGRIELEGMLRQRIARLVGVTADQIGLQEPFTSLGLNSMKVVELITGFGAELDMNLPPTIAFDYPTIERLAAHLCGTAPALGGGIADGMQQHSEAVAIIGMGCRLPGADTPQAFWELLKQGHCTVGEIPPERVALTGYEAGPDDPFRFGSFLPAIDRFDANLFGISPREAQSIDPQQRLLLETAWHALEAANIAPNRLAGSATGVFVGISVNDYFRLQRAAGAGQDTYSGTGSALSIAANRISYALGLQGTSMAIDTACSSSLVAVHLACRSLSSGETGLALAGGVNLVLSSDYGNIFSEAQMLSPTGRCHTFGAAADGYVRGEGCGMVVLKLLRHAERDGDRILGVIRGSAVNQDGASNGLTAPNALAQQQVIRSALNACALPASSIGYVETHGTGTPLGDPIEVAALHQVYGGSGKQDDARDAAIPDAARCWLGAVKPNIGHLESAAGIIGLIKATLVLQHGQIPPLAVTGADNPQIDLSGSRLAITRQLQPWSGSSGDDPLPRRAGVSSFGFGGTNAHLILESHPGALESATSSATPGVQPDPAQAFLMTLSAHSRPALRALANKYADLLQSCRHEDLPTLCQALHGGRAHLSERLCVSGNDIEAMAAALRQYGMGNLAAIAPASHGRMLQRHRIAFLFTGQGAQYVGMGRDLYQVEPVFRNHLDRCDTILRPGLGHSVKEILFGPDSSLLDDTRYAQPAIVALELALAQLWRHYGVDPEFVCGHSVGEYAAACVAGIMSLDAALELVTVRARLMASAPGQGAMLSVVASEASLLQWLKQSGSTLEIAAWNAPDQLVLSGQERDIVHAIEALNAAGMAATRLKVSHAFHSRLMQPVMAEFRAALAKVQFHPPTLRMVATGGGNPGSARFDRDYWGEQLLQPVSFSQAIDSLWAAGADTFIEVGPLPVLTKLAAKTINGGTLINSMLKDGNQHLHWQQALGQLFVSGLQLHLPTPIPAARRMNLPLYEFDRGNYWFQAQASGKQAIQRANLGTTLAGTRLEIAADDIVCLHANLPDHASQWLDDHRLRGEAIMPGAGYVSLMLCAANAAGLDEQGARLSLQGLGLFKPLNLNQGNVPIQTILQKEPQQQQNQASRWQVRVLARSSDSQAWECVASATLTAAAPDQAASAASAALAATSAPTANISNAGLDTAAFYAHWAQQGLEYGPAFRCITQLQLVSSAASPAGALSADTAHAWLELPAQADCGKLITMLHPALLDAAFQSVAALLGQHSQYQGLAPLPTGIDYLELLGPTKGPLQVWTQLCPSPADVPGSERKITANLWLQDVSGKQVAAIRGLQLSMLSIDSLLGLPKFHPPQALATEWVPLSAAPLATANSERIGPSWLLLTDASTDHPLRASLALDTVHLPVYRSAPEQLQEIRLSIERNAKLVQSAVGVIVALRPDHADDDASVHGLLLCRQLQHLLLALRDTSQLPPGFTIAVLTRAAVALAEDEQISLSQAALAAMLRSAALELPGMRIVQIDLAQDLDKADFPALQHTLAQVLPTVPETQLAIRAGKLQVPRARTMALDGHSAEVALRRCRR